MRYYDDGEGWRRIREIVLNVSENKTDANDGLKEIKKLWCDLYDDMDYWRLNALTGGLVPVKPRKRKWWKFW